MTTTTHIRDAVGIFATEQTLQAAIDELLTSGFDRAEISLLASTEVVDEKLGSVAWNVRDLEDDPKAPVAAYAEQDALGEAEGYALGLPMYVAGVTAAGIVAAAGGPLGVGVTAALVAAGAGAGFGGVLARLIGKNHAQTIEKHLDHGGLLLWVRTWTPQDEERALSILRAHYAADVHIHDFSDITDTGMVTSPEGILQSNQIATGEKKRLLRRWEFDQRALLRAEGEGMGDSDGSILSRIQEALKVLNSEVAS